ncbi:MAG: hypothetical protein U1E39_17530 [Planctomycetota bacterium]
MRSRSPTVAGVLVALLAAACGRDAPPRKDAAGNPAAPATVDRSSPDAVWKAAHAALADGDLARLRPYLTPAGEVRLSRDLEAWRALLTDPATGPRVATRVKLPDDPAARAAAQAALATGDAAALLRVFMASEPRGPWVPLPTRSGADGDRIDLEVPAHGGETRPVRLVRTDDGWRIDRLGL